MKRYFIFLLLVIAVNSLAQKKNIFVKEYNKSFELVSFKIYNGDTINRVINLSARADFKKKYGRWINFYSNGKQKSEGYITLIRLETICTPDADPYEELRVGNWKFWDANGNTTTNVYIPETPGDGLYKLFSKDSILRSEGEFKNERLWDGFIYTKYPDSLNFTQRKVLNGKVAR